MPEPDERDIRARRRKLLRALRDVEYTTRDYTVQDAAFTIHQRMLKRTDQFAALAMNEDGKLSFAMSKAERFVNRRRRKTSLGRYARRELELDIADHILGELNAQMMLDGKGIEKSLKILRDGRLWRSMVRGKMRVV